MITIIIIRITLIIGVITITIKNNNIYIYTLYTLLGYEGIYIYNIYICHHGYSYQSQALPQVWELGWVGWDYGKRIDIFYLSFPFQARVVIGEGLVMHLEALGLAMEGNDGINYVIWTAKTHEIPCDCTSCGLGIGAGMGFLFFVTGSR